MNKQGVFPLYTQDTAPRLDNFHCIAANTELLERLRAFGAGETGMLYVHGIVGEGRSHLLQGLCAHAQSAQKSAYYLPLDQAATLEPGDYMSNLQGSDVVCLDDVQAIVGNKQWEEALYHIYNTQQARQGALVVAGEKLPAAMPFVLEDLRSRLESGLVYYLHPLDEQEQKRIVYQCAESMGFELAPKTWDYIIKRSRRNTGVLLDLVTKLDHIALQYKRPLSINLVKEVMGW